jgi:hypothetical protein
MRVKVAQKDFHNLSFTLLDGISAGYGFLNGKRHGSQPPCPWWMDFSHIYQIHAAEKA